MTVVLWCSHSTFTLFSDVGLTRLIACTDVVTNHAQPSERRTMQRPHGRWKELPASSLCDSTVYTLQSTVQQTWALWAVHTRRGNLQSCDSTRPAAQTHRDGCGVGYSDASRACIWSKVRLGTPRGASVATVSVAL